MEKLTEYITHRQTRVDQVLNVIKSNPGLECEQITRKIYTDTPSNLMQCAANNTMSVLVKLEKDGVVHRESRDLSRVCWVSKM